MNYSAKPETLYCSQYPLGYSQMDDRRIVLLLYFSLILSANPSLSARYCARCWQYKIIQNGYVLALKECTLPACQLKKRTEDFDFRSVDQYS